MQFSAARLTYFYSGNDSYHAAADRVFRAVGNQAGRGRLDAAANLRDAKPPRSLILSTGEDIPRGHSVRARLLILEVSRGHICSRKLSACQEDARVGLYAKAMAGFLQWIAARYEGVQAEFQRKIADRRNNPSLEAAHARTPEIIASLQSALEIYLQFAVASGAVNDGEKQKLEERAWQALRKAGSNQGKLQSATEPVARFVADFPSLLTSGRAHLAARNGGPPQWSPESCGWRGENSDRKSSGDCIGWLDGDVVYLDPTASYRVLQKAANEAGESLSVSEQVLRKRLHQKGLLVSTDAARATLTVRRTLVGSLKSVLHFWRRTLLPDEELDDVE